MQLPDNSAILKGMEKTFCDHQLRLLVEALPDAALVVAETGTILAANTHTTSFYQGEIVGKEFISILRTPAVWHAVTQAILHTKIARATHTVPTPVQRTYDVHTSSLGMSENGQRIALLMLRDLSYEQQIERMRSDFVANASHELRTPLASISGFIETMQGAAKNDSKSKDKFLGMMKAQAERMASLIDDLLSLSRIEISEHVIPTEQADLAQIARQAINLSTTSASESGCELKVSIAEPLNVLGDSNQLSQVVHNLIENAIKYAASGKVIEINGSIQEGFVKLEIKDFGPGIAAHHVPRLTERFYRVSTQDSRSRGGTGLGLAICKHIINRHRGRLNIISELGKGSSFTICLPLQNSL